MPAANYTNPISKSYSPRSKYELQTPRLQPQPKYLRDHQSQAPRDLYHQPYQIQKPNRGEYKQSESKPRQLPVIQPVQRQF